MAAARDVMLVTGSARYVGSRSPRRSSLRIRSLASTERRLAKRAAQTSSNATSGLGSHSPFTVDPARDGCPPQTESGRLGFDPRSNGVYI
jgi:hypothetical protein